ncbi:hypothetical protein AAHA92_25257 [Salvia divinorum]|uniref:Uncharacterized protein n=1 Tax=Salvia divinorum TaxID=28513 RepID=A0ABD1GA15_SALDI
MTYLDSPTETIIAIDMVWKEILKKTPFAGAYYHKQEPESHRLAILFGMDDVKLEEEREIIVISDTTEHIVADGDAGESNTVDTEEVNCPNMPPLTRARCKLFDESSEVLDRESTNETARNTYVVHSSIELVKKFGTPVSKYHSPTSHASCGASNSPLGWLH